MRLKGLRALFDPNAKQKKLEDYTDKEIASIIMEHTRAPKIPLFFLYRYAQMGKAKEKLANDDNRQ